MQGEYVRQIAVYVDNSVRRSGCKRMQDLALNMSCRLLSYISCAGRCESLPHRSHMTGSDGGQSYLRKLKVIESLFVQPLLSIWAELKDMSILLEVHQV